MLAASVAMGRLGAASFNLVNSSDAGSRGDLSRPARWATPKSMLGYTVGAP